MHFSKKVPDFVLAYFRTRKVEKVPDMVPTIVPGWQHCVSGFDGHIQSLTLNSAITQNFLIGWSGNLQPASLSMGSGLGNPSIHEDNWTKFILKSMPKYGHGSTNNIFIESRF